MNTRSVDDLVCDFCGERLALHHSRDDVDLNKGVILHGDCAYHQKRPHEPLPPYITAARQRNGKQ
jgi:hypothetical protein